MYFIQWIEYAVEPKRCSHIKDFQWKGGQIKQICSPVPQIAENILCFMALCIDNELLNLLISALETVIISELLAWNHISSCHMNQINHVKHFLAHKFRYITYLAKLIADLSSRSVYLKSNIIKKYICEGIIRIGF